MIKRNKWKLIITSAVILLPILLGVILWGKMPETMPVHWGADGKVDGYSSKAFAIFAIPLFMLAIHWVCFFATMADPKNKNIDGKPLNLVLWICPSMSLLVGTVTLSYGLGMELSVDLIIPIFMGLLMIVMGNYMPKCKQNYSIGVKVPWTLNDKENWNKTHRFAGIAFVVGGIIIILTSLLRSFVIFFGVVILISVLPVIYSYVYYKKHKKD